MKRHSRYDLPGRGPNTIDWRDKMIASPFMKKYGAFMAAAALMLTIGLTKTDTIDMPSETGAPEPVENHVYRHEKESITADTTRNTVSVDVAQTPLVP